MKKSWLKWGIFSFACLATLIALFYAEEDWRGARELARVKKEVEAKGESLDPQALIPPPIPDELNVAAAPIFAELYEKGDAEHREETRFYRLKEFFEPRQKAKSLPKLPAVGSPYAFSLAAWQKWLTGTENPSTALSDVWAELDKLRPVTDEIEAALARPGVRWPVTQPDNPFAEKLPYMDAAIQLARFLDLRSLVEIDAGDGEAALHDLATIFRMAAVVEHRFLVGYLVGRSCDSFGYGLIARGLERRVWNVSQLGRVEGLLGQKDYLSGWREAVRQERWQAVRFHEMPRREQASLLGIFAPMTDKATPPSWPDRAFLAAFLLRPRGWSKLDEAYSIQIEQQGWIDSVDPAKGTVDVAAEEEVLRGRSEMPRRGGRGSCVLSPWRPFLLFRPFSPKSPYGKPN